MDLDRREEDPEPDAPRPQRLPWGEGAAEGTPMELLGGVRYRSADPFGPPARTFGTTRAAEPAPPAAMDRPPRSNGLGAGVLWPLLMLSAAVLTGLAMVIFHLAFEPGTGRGQAIDRPGVEARR